MQAAPPSVRLLSSVRVILSESLADAAHPIYLEKSSSKVNHLLCRVKVFIPSSSLLGPTSKDGHVRLSSLAYDPILIR